LADAEAAAADAATAAAASAAAAFPGPNLPKRAFVADVVELTRDKEAMDVVASVLLLPMTSTPGMSLLNASASKSEAKTLNWVSVILDSLPAAFIGEDPGTVPQRS
jgi:hypothetical protein